MPPKKNNKNQQQNQKKDKPQVDKTFGMKNKKGANGQKEVKARQSAITGKTERSKFEDMAAKKEKEKKEKEEREILKDIYSTRPTYSASNQPKEVDPKTIICEFFKQGLCQKGRKCKFSHNLQAENGKMQKIDIYTDQRDQLKTEEEKKEDEENQDMSNWDETKLAEVVEKKQKKYGQQKQSEIVCKYFIQAIQREIYGWRWECPNGLTCHYRHCLPPGYVMRSNIQPKKKEDLYALEAKIDQQIGSLAFDKTTRVTEEVFWEWKKRRDLKRQMEKEKALKEKVKKVTKAKGKQHLMTGIALFQQDPNMFQGNEGEQEEQDGFDELYKNREEVGNDADFEREGQQEEN